MNDKYKQLIYRIYGMVLDLDGTQDNYYLAPCLDDEGLIFRSKMVMSGALSTCT